MSTNSLKMRLSLRLFGAIIGFALLAFLVRRADPTKLLANVAALGWGVALVIALGGIALVVRTWAWQLTLSSERHGLSFTRMFGLRLASEAGGQLGLVGQVFGDTFRVSFLSRTIPVANAISSVTLDRGLFMVTGAIVSILGVTSALAALPLSHKLRLCAGIFSITLFGFVFLIAFAMRKRWPVFSTTARMIGRVRYFSWVEKKRSLIDSIETKLLDFHHNTPGAFWASLILNLVSHLMAVLEVFLILWLMGSKISFFGALLIEALTKVVNVAGALIPGNIGAYEGGNVLMAKIFGLSAAVGLTLGLTRRLRSLFWAVVGVICLVMMPKSKKQTQHGADTAAPDEITAVILANYGPSKDGLVSPLMRVGALPILLRAVLGAKKAGAERIIILIEPTTGPELRRTLLKTRRLPDSVEWLEAPAKARLSRILGQIASQSGTGRLIVVAGNRTYHPSLLRKATEWKGERPALALVTGQNPASIYAVPRDMILELAGRQEARVFDLDDLHDWLIATHSVECAPVEENMWQHVATEEDRASAEQKLDRWLVKPTDGFFAQTNRRISIPISRQMIKLPITPNMVSVFTLGVGLVSAVFFAQGGYLYTLAGAVLSLAASILDGCDGEVARLKLQESDFGCWLETICDYLYYLFIFTGLTIGLSRNSGGVTWLIWGGLLVFGAIASFFATGYSRARLASDRPEQLLRIWHAQAESRLSDPLLFIGRRTEFLVRRCFLPYALLAFALLGITKIAFILCAVGANCVWPISLYSCLSFSRRRTAPAASPDRPAELEEAPPMIAA